jgi:micrococcal nuclease
METDSDIVETALEMRRAELDRLALDQGRSGWKPNNAASQRASKARQTLRDMLDRRLKAASALALIVAITATVIAPDAIAADHVVSARPSEISIIDGDTIEHAGIRYRLMGFDTPETIQAKCVAELRMGRDARAKMIERIASVDVVSIRKSGRRDRYGRELAWLYVGGVNVADYMISIGLAREYHGGPREGWCNAGARISP